MATPEWEVPGSSEARGERSIMPAFAMPDVAASDRPIADPVPDPAPPLEPVVEPSAAANLPRLARPCERRHQLLLGGGTASIAGTLMTGAAVQLSPGVDRFDAFARELVEVGGNAFEVDGDPGTRTEAVAGARILPTVHDHVVQVVLAAPRRASSTTDASSRPTPRFELPQGRHCWDP